MIDHKYSYFNNVIKLYNTFGYRSLTTYDKYHIILNIITIFTDNYKYNLGQLVTKLKPKFLHKHKILGMNEKSEYIVPTLYDMSMFVIKRNNIYSEHNFYNKEIIKTSNVSSIYDRNIFIHEYFMNVFMNNQLKELIINLIENFNNNPQLLLTSRYDNDAMDYETNSDSDTEAIELVDESESESENESESEEEED